MSVVGADDKLSYDAENNANIHKCYMTAKVYAYGQLKQFVLRQNLPLCESYFANSKNAVLLTNQNNDVCNVVISAKK